ncbi:hypothetical protein LX32DRAFT_441204 [Colletotrichum zoysiae]|uniref:Uncharacterized protein n=1 Tax=Colletotrichum zoysiae TaxID=1216348 RepID=A0AAD9M5I1_9PEZI|nr:hypothetical protein LX32DRAFT_441204 [Colletotrichum zoysiae]
MGGGRLGIPDRFCFPLNEGVYKHPSMAKLQQSFGCHPCHTDVKVPRCSPIRPVFTPRPRQTPRRGPNPHVSAALELGQLFPLSDQCKLYYASLALGDTSPPSASQASFSFLLLVLNGFTGPWPVTHRGRERGEKCTLRCPFTWYLFRGCWLVSPDL